MAFDSEVFAPAEGHLWGGPARPGAMAGGEGARPAGPAGPPPPAGGAPAGGGRVAARAALGARAEARAALGPPGEAARRGGAAGLRAALAEASQAVAGGLEAGAAPPRALLEAGAAWCAEAAGLASAASGKAGMGEAEAAALLRVAHEALLAGAGMLEAGAQEGASEAAGLGMLGEAQALATAHAAGTGKSPGLVATVAFGAASLFERAAERATEEGQGGQKAAVAQAQKYLLWRASVARAQAWGHQGLTYLEGDGEEAGLARRCTLHALKVLQESRVSPGYGQEKSTCRKFEAGVLGQLTRIDRSVESQNAIVYFKRVPAELPAPLAPKILAVPTKFEAPVRPLEEGEEMLAKPTRVPRESEAGVLPPERQRPGCRGFRFLAVCVAMPALALISLVGYAASLVLLPAALLCPCVGALPLLAARSIELLAKAPFHACLWASAAPARDPTPPPVPRAQPADAEV